MVLNMQIRSGMDIRERLKRFFKETMLGEFLERRAKRGITVLLMWLVFLIVFFIVEIFVDIFLF